MATLREIKRRIVSVKSTQKITKAMKMVAAAKLKKAQANVLNSRPYSNKLASLLKHLVKKVEKSTNPLLIEREVNKILFIVVTSDRGLCGSFNTNLLKKAVEVIHKDYKEYFENNKYSILTIGKKGTDYFSKRNYNIYDKKINIFNKLEHSIANDIANKIINDYLNKVFDKVIVIFNEFRSVGRINLKAEQILPIPEETDEQNVSTDSKKLKEDIDYIYEPDSKTILNSLLPKHLVNQIWRVLLESYVSEQGARMTAMEMATENAGEMIRSLNLIFNKARQSAITKELLEIVAGAEALKEKS